MKQIYAVLVFPLFLFMLIPLADAGTLSVGAQSWYVWWDSGLAKLNADIVESSIKNEMDQEQIDAVIPKGTDTSIDSYSGFFDNGHRQATGLGDYLNERNVSEVTIMGLATDYCVKFTALDAVRHGLKTSLVQAGCRGVDLNEGDIQRALQEMQAAGVALI